LETPFVEKNKSLKELITGFQNISENCGTFWIQIQKHLCSEPSGLHPRALDEQQGVTSSSCTSKQRLKKPAMGLPVGHPTHIANHSVWELTTLDADVTVPTLLLSECCKASTV